MNQSIRNQGDLMYKAENRKKVLKAALDILGISYEKSDNANALAKLLRDAIPHPASQNEFEISKTIKSLIGAGGNMEKADTLVRRLAIQVSYSVWD